ncbi:hypothetical protein VPH35_045194 [Triticum aestivum]
MMSSTPSSTSTAGTPTPRSGFGRSTPRARSSTPCSATSSPPTWGPVVALARASDGVVDWSLLDAPVVEEVVGPNGVDFVTGDGDLAFGSGIRVRDMVGPFELVVCDGAGRGRAELQLPSVSVVCLLSLLLQFFCFCLLACYALEVVWPVT